MSNPHPISSFNKGETANRNGAPDNGSTFKAMYQRNIMKTPGEFNSDNEEKMTLKEILVRGRIKRAHKGNESAQDKIEDRVEGKPVQPTDLTSGGDKIEPKIDVAGMLSKAYGSK